MFADPRTGDTMLVTKTAGARAQLFRIPARPFDGSTAVAEQVGLLDVGSKVTGAAIWPDGSRIVVRTGRRLPIGEGAGARVDTRPVPPVAG